LLGALKQSPDQLHGKGVGTFLAHILESSAIESLGASGAFGGLTSILTAIAAVLVIARGAGGLAHAALYLATIGVAIGLTARYARARMAWTEARFELTGHVVENLIGHKTRLAQKEPSERNTGEDRRLEQYVSTEAALNRSAVALEMLRRAWPWIGLFALAPLVISGTPGRSNAWSHEHDVRSDALPDHGNLTRRTDQRPGPGLDREFGQPEDCISRTAPKAYIFEVACAHGREHRHRGHQTGWQCFGNSADYRVSAEGVNCYQPGLQCCDSLRCPGDGIGDVVQLEVKEKCGVGCRRHDLLDALRTVSQVELQPQFQS
jgi:hypothetical protein